MTAKKTDKPAAAPTLPDIGKAQTELARFQIRTGVSLIVRVILLAVLVTLLRQQNPSWEAASPLLHAGATVLAVWPLFTAQGKLWAGRIRLGARYLDAGRAADAAQLLAPLARPAARAFDARREGTLLLARALANTGHAADARRLAEAVARDTREPAIREQALALLRK